MTDRIIRVGKVSSIDYGNGMVSVTYPDLDDATTVKMPAFSFTNEYHMPKVGDDILVCHLSNGQTAGIVMGRYWNKANQCQHTGPNVLRKELDDEYGKAVIDYDGSTGTLEIRAPKIKIISDDDEMTLDSGSIRILSDLTTNSGLYTTPADVVAQGKSLAGHTHTGVHGETSGPN